MMVFVFFCLYLSLSFASPLMASALLVESEQFDIGTKDDCARCVWGVE